MHLKTNVVQTITQKQKLSMQQQYALNILTMSDAQLQMEMEKMVEENPLLEYSEDYVGIYNGEDIYEKASLFVHNKETLQDVLYFQLHTCDLPIDVSLAEFLIESLDSNGYLPKDSLSFLGYDEEQIEDTLAILQTFEPYGVFARNVQECLLIQLCTTNFPYTKTAIHIVNFFMEELSTNHRKKICDTLHLPMQEVNAAIQLIRTLDPKPGAKYARDALPQKSEASIFILQDHIQIQMNYANCPLQINHQYDTLEDEVAKAYIQKATRHAQTFIDCLSKRTTTLFTILSCVCEIQYDYFLHGDELKPLTLKDVASKVNFHESTISRAISQKAIEFEGRYHPIKEFFSTRLESGQSVVSIHHKIQTLIMDENSHKPYSDQQIALLLEKEDIKISRRTVAKYREQLKIRPAAQRKDYEGGSKYG